MTKIIDLDTAAASGRAVFSGLTSEHMHKRNKRGSNKGIGERLMKAIIKKTKDPKNQAERVRPLRKERKTVGNGRDFVRASQREKKTREGNSVQLQLWAAQNRPGLEEATNKISPTKKSLPVSAPNAALAALCRWLFFVGLNTSSGRKVRGSINCAPVCGAAGFSGVQFAQTTEWFRKRGAKKKIFTKGKDVLVTHVYS